MKRATVLKLLISAAAGSLAVWFLVARVSPRKETLVPILSALTSQVIAPPFVQRDLVYGQAGGVDLKLDFARPSEGSGPFPLVICIHGGAWRSGSKSGYAVALPLLVQHGYAAASLDYRLAPRYPFPAQIEDVRRAVRYLDQRAAGFKIDPNRLGAMGDSAGGHLALLLGLSDPNDTIRAVVNLYGPADLPRWKAGPEGEAALTMSSAKVLDTVFGTSDRASVTLRAASPIHQIGKARPAVLTLHGEADPVVKAEQAIWLHQALRTAGFQEKLVIVKGASHGLQGTDLANAIGEVTEFLAAHLKAERHNRVEPAP
ncbi:MAG: alpha/beta hydrolase fold domain-containing protein [Bryobacteraceae bacterium]